MEDISRFLTEEPGRLIAKTIADEKDHSEVLQTNQSVINGAFAYFLKSAYGKHFLNLMPPDSYPDFASSPVGSSLSIDDKEFHWVSKGFDAGGALNTAAFHISTNGSRAKAARAMSAFVCKEFVVPPGVKQVPSDETDLTNRPYCQTCHITLEPLSRFFTRWPLLGSENYFYDRSLTISPQGEYKGENGADVRGLAKLMAKDPEFSSCSVRRGFEFLLGRYLTESEVKNVLPSYVSDFEANGKKLWPVLKEFLMSSTFDL